MAKKEGKIDHHAAWKKAEARRTGSRQGGSCVIDANGEIVSEDRPNKDVPAKPAEGGSD